MKKDRNRRMEVLRMILNSTEMSSQESLLRELKAHGYVITQATLSRDLQKIKAAKVSTSSGYRYTLSETPNYQRKTQVNIPEFFRNTGFQGIEFSGNIVVIHTRPGYAGGVTSEIDAHGLSTLCGTIAGNDTIFAVMREGVDRQAVIDELSLVIPAIKSILL